MSWGETFNVGGRVAAIAASLITPSLAVNRSSGVAPLAIHFDATATVSPATTTRPFHELRYRWDFGDGSGGNFAYGAQTGLGSPKSRNTDVGAVAAHVYKTAGSYTATLYVDQYVAGVLDSAPVLTQAVTVTAANTYWAGTKTICVSATGSTTGAPSGATIVTSSDADAAIAANIGSGDVRILFNRGETFSVSTPILIKKAGASMIGAYGTGSKPILSATGDFDCFTLGDSANPSFNDWRFDNITVEGNGSLSGSGFRLAASIDKVTYNEVDVNNYHVGWSGSPTFLDAINNSSYTNPLWDSHCINECTFNGSTGTWPGAGAGGNGMYYGGARLSILGCLTDPNYLGEHGIRIPHSIKGVIRHNTTQRVQTGKAFLSLRAVDQGTSTFPTGTYGTYCYAELTVCGDNYNYSVSSGQSVDIGCGPVNAKASGRCRNFVFDGNWLEGEAAATLLMGVSCTARHNLYKVASGQIFNIESTTNNTSDGPPVEGVNSPTPDDLFFYGNSAYITGTGSAYFAQLIAVSLTGSTVTLKNNLMYGPSCSAPTNMINNLQSPGPTLVTSNNTVQSQINTNPFSTTTPPTTPAHYIPQTGSYARNSGATVADWADFVENVYAASSRDAGAMQH